MDRTTTTTTTRPPLRLLPAQELKPTFAVIREIETMLAAYQRANTAHDWRAAQAVAQAVVTSSIGLLDTANKRVAAFAALHVVPPQEA